MTFHKRFLSLLAIGLIPTLVCAEAFDFQAMKSRLSVNARILHDVGDVFHKHLDEVLIESKANAKLVEEQRALRSINNDAEQLARDVDLLVYSLELAELAVPNSVGQAIGVLNKFCDDLGFTTPAGESWMESTADALGVKAKKYPKFSNELRQLGAAYRTAGLAGVNVCERLRKQ